MIFALREETGVNLTVVNIGKMPVLMSALDAERPIADAESGTAADRLS